MTNKQKQAVREMRQRGETYSAIAKMLGLSPNTIKSFCHRENISSNSVYIESNKCKNCSAPLTQLSGVKQRIFCSDKCRYTWWNKNRQYAECKRRYILTCLYCGSNFESYGNKHRKYCGRECYNHSRYGEGLP